MKTEAEIMKFSDMQIMKEHRFPSTLILICGILAAGIGFVALIGWYAGLPLLSTLGSGRIPMAPSAALLFILYGAGVLLLSRPSPNRAVFRTGMVIGAAGAMFSLLLFILSSMGIHPEAEHFGIRIVETLKGAHVGHISPVSAFCFVFVGLSFLASLSSSNGRTKATSIAFWSSVLVVLSSLVLLLAYILGSPFLYGSSVIPPSLPTSLAFLLVGTALLVYSGQLLLPHSSLSEMTDTRSSYALLMIFLLLIAGIVITGYLYLRNYEQEYRIGVEQQFSSTARMNVEEMYAPLRRQLWTIIALIGALLIGAGSGVAFLWRQQHARFYRERYETAEELRKTEEQYRVLFNTMDEGFCIVELLYDPDGKAVDYRFVEVNPAFEKLTGLQQTLGKTIREIVPDNEEYWFEIYGNVARTGESIRFQNTVHGLRKYFDVLAFRVGGDESRRVAILFNDITERKRAEQELMEAKAIVDAVVENIPLMLFLKEAADLRFVIFNRAGEELLDHERKDLIGKSDLDFFPPEQAAYFMVKDREVLDGETGMLDIPEEPIMTAKKGRRLLHTRKVCIRGGDGTTKYLLGISEDITERKQAEETLKSYSAELEKTNKELQEALDNIKTLSGMLPICASCKKIRDDKGYWSGVESYITEHSEAEFTSGICPECEKKMYEDLEKIKKENF